MGAYPPRCPKRPSLLLFRFGLQPALPTLSIKCRSASDPHNLLTEECITYSSGSTKFYPSLRILNPVAAPNLQWRSAGGIPMIDRCTARLPSPCLFLHRTARE